MLCKRIIPCLDIKDGRTVKGINFVSIKDAGDPVELALSYSEQGADELVFLDITATHEKRKTLAKLAGQVAAQLNIPFTVGGGISSIDDVSTVLNEGADKISINSSAVKNPELINQLAKHFGSQCIVLAVDTRFATPSEAGVGEAWYVYLNGGRIKTKLKTSDWIKEAVERGAGEILLTSMNHDGTKNGFANELNKMISELVNVPIIASGGAGEMKHFYDAFTEGKADAALAASVFHYGEIKIPELKGYLIDKGVNMRKL